MIHRSQALARSQPLVSAHLTRTVRTEILKSMASAAELEQGQVSSIFTVMSCSTNMRNLQTRRQLYRYVCQRYVAYLIRLP